MLPRHAVSDLGALVAYVYAEPLSDKPAASCAGLLADAQGGAQAPAFGIIDIGIYGEAFGFLCREWVRASPWFKDQRLR
jgi:hypothetical protein